MSSDMKLSAKVIEATAEAIYATWLADKGGEQHSWEYAKRLVADFGEDEAPVTAGIIALARKEANAAILAALEAMVAEGNAVNARCRWALDQGDHEPDWIASTIAAPTEGNFPVLIIRMEQT